MGSPFRPSYSSPLRVAEASIADSESFKKGHHLPGVAKVPPVACMALGGYRAKASKPQPRQSLDLHAPTMKPGTSSRSSLRRSLPLKTTDLKTAAPSREVHLPQSLEQDQGSVALDVANLLSRPTLEALGEPSLPCPCWRARTPTSGTASASSDGLELSCC